MFFLIMGAWPVFGFFGLDALLIYWAFRINYARAAAYEVVTVTPVELSTTRPREPLKLTLLKLIVAPLVPSTI